jgi:type IV pilus assembly protein PilF
MPKSKFLSHMLLMMFGIISLYSCSSKKNANVSKKAGLFYGQGTADLINKKYTDALKNLLNANELEPNNSEIINNLGMAYYFKGQRDLAIQHLNKAIELNEKNADAKSNLATIYYHEGNIKKAEKLYKEVTTDLTYEKLAITYYNLGVLELDKKKNSLAAENYFKKSLEEDENYCPSYFQIGLIKYGQRKFNTALKNFKEASMGVCYEIPAPIYHQALALIELKEYDEARLKLDMIETRFKDTPYYTKAKNKILELGEIQTRFTSEKQASGNLFESPEF